ncbi:hypothetical protein R84B8_01348 [Treponema sp. R8-4-B8]
MRVYLNLKILILAIIAAAIVIITVSFLMAHFAVCGACGDNNYDLSQREASQIDKKPVKILTSFTNNSNCETAEDFRCLAVTNVIQRVLENTLKDNDDIALMAVYSEDGTILADLKPDRIGKNIFEIDEDFNHFVKEMCKAMKNRRIYSGFKFDPMLNEYIRFIVKPMQIGNFDQRLSLLIGVHKSK